ncbi:MAG: lysylphosphatidylglycerol synthase transmembrane domain-containing protein [Candidatus Lernaella stagnicola]|nr:lysylphosphatidylglycerol synthase transmembrane domain-containing protein [Candidatus Lernaella stagnicola]
MRQSWKVYLPFAITGLLLGLLLFLYGDRRLLAAFTGIRLAPLALGVFFTLLTLLIGGTDRWRRIVRMSGTDLSWNDAWRMRLGGAPLKMVTPLRVSELLRAPYLVQRYGIPTATALGVVAFEKAVIVLGVAPALAVRVAVYGEVASLYVFVLTAVIVTLFATSDGRQIVLRSTRQLAPAQLPRVEQLLTAFSAAGFGGTLKWVGYSTVLTVTEAAALAFCLQAVGVELPVIEWLTVLPAVLLVAMVSFTVGGLGAREAALVLLFPALDPHSLMAGAMVFFVVAKVGVSALGLFWLPSYLRGMAKTD